MPRDTLTRHGSATDDPTDYVVDLTELTDDVLPPAKARRIDRMAGSPAASSRRGWGAFNEAAAKKSEGGYPERFTLEEESSLMVFLEDGPLQVWEEHWINEAPGKRKSFACAPSVQDDALSCALCDELDDKPSLFAAFNVAVHDDGVWKLKVLTGRVRVVKAVQALANGRTTSPINKDGLYFEAYKTGKGTESTPHFDKLTVAAGEVLASEVIPPEKMAELKGKLWTQYAYAPKQEDVDMVVDFILKQ